MKVLIADDETRAREFLHLVLARMPEVQVVGQAENGLRAVELAQNTEPDLVFLDIKMPEMDGLEAAKELMSFANPPRVVFVTAFDQFAVDAFKVQALDYLVKPFSPETVRNTVERVKKNINQPSLQGVGERLENLLHLLDTSPRSTKLPIPLEGGNIVLIDTRDIHYIERRGLEVLVKTGKKTYSTNINLKEFESRLDANRFFRCHKGFIVKLDLIEEIVHSGRTFELLLSTGEKVLLSREKEKVLRVLYQI